MLTKIGSSFIEDVVLKKRKGNFFVKHPNAWLAGLAAPLYLGGKFLDSSIGGVAFLGKHGLKGVQSLGDVMVKHPKGALMVGAPALYSAYKLPERIYTNVDNVSPQNFYYM